MIQSQKDATDIITGRLPDCSKEDIRRAWQYLVDRGTVWSMGKWWSDMAACQIAAGTIERNAA